MLCPYCGIHLRSTAREGWALVVSAAMAHIRQECTQRSSETDPMTLQRLAEAIADEAVALLDEPRG